MLLQAHLGSPYLLMCKTGEALGDYCRACLRCSYCTQPTPRVCLSVSDQLNTVSPCMLVFNCPCLPQPHPHLECKIISGVKILCCIGLNAVQICVLRTYKTNILQRFGTGAMKGSVTILKVAPKVAGAPAGRKEMGNAKKKKFTIYKLEEYSSQ